MIWPIKKPTLEREPSERIIALSTPKPNFLRGDKITRYISVQPSDFPRYMIYFAGMSGVLKYSVKGDPLLIQNKSKIENSKLD